MKKTPLHVAAVDADLDVVQYLVDSSADFNAVDKIND